MLVWPGVSVVQAMADDGALTGSRDCCWSRISTPIPAAAEAPASSFNRLVLTLSATPVKPTFTAVTEVPQGDSTIRNGTGGVVAPTA